MTEREEARLERLEEQLRAARRDHSEPCTCGHPRNWHSSAGRCMECSCLTLRDVAERDQGECWCRECEEAHLADLPELERLMGRRFIVCPTCGNKRCPRAESHHYRCSGSNALDQTPVYTSAERDQGDEHSEARRVPSMDETLKRAYGVLHALAIGDSSPRTFKRISIVTDSPQYEFCEHCQKHIGRHYGNAETATQEWPAYRCDPKPDVAEPVVSPGTVPRADYDRVLAALRECVADRIERGHEFSKHAYQAATRRLREVAGM